jgi:hypothetical protein
MSDLSDNGRSSFRVPLANIVGEYSHKGTVDKCDIMDLSFAGLGLKINHIIGTGDVIDIRFYLDKTTKIYCKAKIVSSRGGRVGVSFVEIPEKSKRAIHKHIEDYTNHNLNKMLKKIN